MKKMTPPHPPCQFFLLMLEIVRDYQHLGRTSSVSLGLSYCTSTLLQSHVYAEGLTMSVSKYDDDEHCSWLSIKDSFSVQYLRGKNEGQVIFREGQVQFFQQDKYTLVLHKAYIKHGGHGFNTFKLVWKLMVNAINTCKWSSTLCNRPSNTPKSALFK